MISRNCSVCDISSSVGGTSPSRSCAMYGTLSVKGSCCSMSSRINRDSSSNSRCRTAQGDRGDRPLLRLRDLVRPGVHGDLCAGAANAENSFSRQTWQPKLWQGGSPGGMSIWLSRSRDRISPFRDARRPQSAAMWTLEHARCGIKAGAWTLRVKTGTTPHALKETIMSGPLTFCHASPTNDAKRF